MKIQKNGKTVNLSESEVKKIINRFKINRFLSEDRIARVKHNKNTRIELIIDKLRELNNILKTTEYGSEINKILNEIDESVEKQIEKIEDKLNGKDKKDNNNK